MKGITQSYFVYDSVAYQESKEMLELLAKERQSMKLSSMGSNQGSVNILPAYNSS